MHRDLFIPATRKLTKDELTAAFGDSMVLETVSNLWAEEFLHCTFKPEAGPYGDTLEVCYVNPELQYDRNGEIKVESIRKSYLFTGGTMTPCRFSYMVCSGFEAVWYIAGRFDGGDARPKFYVYGSGLTNQGGHILWMQQHQDNPKSEKFYANITRHALFTATFTHENGKLYDVFILHSNTALTKNGNLAKGQSIDANTLLAKVRCYELGRKFVGMQDNDGVVFADAWVLDAYGREVPPDFTEPIPLKEVLVGTQRKIWMHPCWGQVYISCTMEPDGDIRLEYEHPFFFSDGHGELTVLQQRRMTIIRQRIIGILSRNFESIGETFDESKLQFVSLDTRF